MTDLLLHDLAIILLFSGLAALVCHRLNQPKLAGYVLAGIIIGPHTPPFAYIRDPETIRTLGELGVVLLMFSLGLDFNLRKIRRLGATPLVTALLDVSVMVWLGYLLGRWAGWTPLESLFLGAIVCDSSTTILARILQDMNKQRERFSHLALGITLVEDVLAVVLIAALTGLSLTGSVQTGLMAVRLWQLLLFLGVGTIVGLFVVPRWFDYLLRLRNEELLTVMLVGLCFGVALLATRLQLSMALGAVMIGAVVSESRAQQQCMRIITPLRHVFSAVFFVTIGLRLEPAGVLAQLPLVVCAVLLVIAGKFLANSLGVLLCGHDPGTGLRVGIGLAQVGEFAFIISALALTLGVARPEIYQVGVATAVITTLLNPVLIRGGDRLAARVERNATWLRLGEFSRFYGQWIDRIGRSSSDTAVRRLVRRAVLMVMVNCLFIGSIFGGAGYLARMIPHWVSPPFQSLRYYNVLLWLGAAAAALPFYVVTFRKLEALSMILIEATLPPTLRGAWTQPVRRFLGISITTVCGAGLVLMTFILSSTLLPSLEVFVLLILLTAIVAVRAQSRLSGFYARYERALHMVLAESAEAKAASRPLSKMDFEMILLTGEWLSAPSLRSLDLRARTGVNVVAVQRGGHQVDNPAPDLSLQAGDRLFLLGSPEEISAARRLLSPMGARPDVSAGLRPGYDI